MKKTLFAALAAVSLASICFVAGRASADYTVSTASAQWTSVSVTRDATTGNLDATICGTVYKNDGGVADTGCVEHVPMQTGGPTETCITQSAAGAMQTLIAGKGW